MKDYNVPPTDEFKMLSESSIRNDLNRWFTLQKAVMNDYWFDHFEHVEVNAVNLDHLFHKLYYCWMMMGKSLYGDEEE